MNLKRLTLLMAVLALVLAACGGGTTETTAGPSETTTAMTETTTAMTETTTAMTETTEAMANITTIDPGTLTICTDSPYPPMEFEKDGEFTGFDIELMRKIAGDLGLDLAVNNTGFDPITSGTAMASGQCDMAAASITITDERKQAVDFSDPYFTADQSLLTKKDSGITTLADLSGKNLGVQTGTTGEMYAQENAPSDATITSFENPGDLFVALESGEIVAILQDLVVNGPRTLEDDTVTVVETYPTNEEYGFAYEKGANPDLQAAVNDLLAKYKDDGTYDALYQEWFGSASTTG